MLSIATEVESSRNCRNRRTRLHKIAVIGSTGMLGRAVANADFAGYDIVEINRHSAPVLKRNYHVKIGEDISNLEDLIDLKNIDYIVNCVGLIRQKMNKKILDHREAVLYANFKIPLKLVALSERYNFKIIQIGTDCVFSGAKGNYLETDRHDALDLYGKTKSLGEIPHENLSIIRASIVGKEFNSQNSLLSWFLSQHKDAKIKGFTDQIWNGITVHHFAKIVAGIVNSQKFDQFARVHHVVPADAISKDLLLRMFATAFGRDDIQIVAEKSGRNLNMTLGTNDPALNQMLWKLAGYGHPLSIQEMIVEYSSFIQSGG